MDWKRACVALMIIIFAGSLTMSNRKVNELYQKGVVLQGRVNSLEIQVMKTWGMSSLLLITDVSQNDPNAHDKVTELMKLESALNRAITSDETVTVCDQIVRKIQERYDAKDFDRQSWILESQIEHYKYLVGTPTAHPNSSL